MRSARAVRAAHVPAMPVAAPSASFSAGWSAVKLDPSQPSSLIKTAAPTAQITPLAQALAAGEAPRPVTATPEAAAPRAAAQAAPQSMAPIAGLSGMSRESADTADQSQTLQKRTRDALARLDFTGLFDNGNAKSSLTPVPDDESSRASYSVRAFVQQFVKDSGRGMGVKEYGVAGISSIYLAPDPDYPLFMKLYLDGISVGRIFRDAAEAALGLKATLERQGRPLDVRIRMAFSHGAVGNYVTGFEMRGLD
ncbi:MAG: hypothetical protein WC881_07650 [Elusimicrobiota bacterium]